MTKELETKKKTELANYNPNELGAAGEIDASDLLIGRIGVLQPLSDLCKKGKLKPGVICNTETEEEIKSPLDVIILKSNKYWQITKNDEFVERIPGISQNDYAWEEGDIKRMFVHAFFVLLPADLANGVVMPYEISFRSTELKTAKRLSKMLYLLGQSKKPSWEKVFTLTVEEKKKAKYSWFGFHVSPSRDTKDAEKVAAYKMFSQIKNAEEAGRIATADEDTTGVESVPATDDCPF